MSKDQLAAWAFSVLRECSEKAMFGTVTISMQNGVIGSVKVEESFKPPIDQK